MILDQLVSFLQLTEAVFCHGVALQVVFLYQLLSMSLVVEVTAILKLMELVMLKDGHYQLLSHSNLIRFKF